MDGSSFDPVWEEIFRTQEWGKYPDAYVIRFVARGFYKAADRRKVRLLDLGSGPGATAWYLAREGFSVSAIDGSATAIERLGKRLAAEHLEADARVGDVGRLPWGDGTFDAVIDNACLCCNPWASALAIVGEVHRVLKPGGQFFSSNFSDRTHGYGLGRQVEPGGFADIPSGPLAGKGFNRFLGRAQIDQLYAAFAQRSVERLLFTTDELQHEIELWNVTCRK